MLISCSFFFLFLLLVNAPVKITSHTANEWRSRTIYQILTDRFASTAVDTSKQCSNLSVYCGGNYNGLINKLDYIAGMGFDAIWISPMPTNLGNDYHGYAFLDLYSPNPHFGSEANLKTFITEAHNRDIWVMLDVVGKSMCFFTFFSVVSPFLSFSFSL
jgi:alpha-amylase